MESTVRGPITVLPLACISLPFPLIEHTKSPAKETPQLSIQSLSMLRTFHQTQMAKDRPNEKHKLSALCPNMLHTRGWDTEGQAEVGRRTDTCVP